MTEPTRARRTITVLFGGALALALSLGLGTAAAHADDSDDSGIGVTVPTPSPTATTTPNPTPTSTNTSTTTTTNRSNSTTGTTTTPTPTEPAIPNRPATSGAEAHVDRDDETYRPGGNVTVTAEGFTAGEQVQVVLYSDPILIGNIAADSNGAFTHTFALPDDLELGKHTVQLTGWESQRVALADLLVVAAAAGDTSSDAWAIPAWIWWIAGIVLLLLAALALWWIIRIMRQPGTEEAIA